MPDIKYLQIDPKDVLPRPESVSYYMGYENAENGFTELILEALAGCVKAVDIKAGYCVLESEIKVEPDKGRINFPGAVFNTGCIISEQLQGSNDLVIFALTLGSGFDAWSRDVFNNGDPVKGYIIDSIGSLTAENSAKWLHDIVENDFSEMGLNCTNRFSPGYCGWKVDDQQVLFNILPDGFCGIRLNSSSLMEPVKSISGIVGIGKSVARSDYLYSSCLSENCIKMKQEDR